MPGSDGGVSPHWLRHEHVPLKTLIATLAAALVVFIGGAVVWYGLGAGFSFGSGSLVQTGSPVAVPHGVILLSLASPQSSATYGQIRPAVYDFFLNRGFDLPVNEVASTSITTTEQYRFSSDGQWGVFIGQGVLADSTSTREAPQVYRVDVSKAPNLTSVIETVQKAAVAITDDTDDKRAPAISTTGNVLYMALHVGADPANTPEAATIIYVPLQGEARAITQGSYPQWVDANRFIYLGNDGIYMYSLDSGSSSRIWSIKGGGITASSMLRLSDDKSTIAWSIPQYGVVTILRVVNWDRPSIQFVGTVSVDGAWPVIAHDSQAFAVLTAPTGTTATTGTQALQIAVYDVATLKLLYTIPLPSVDPISTSMTDWRL